MYTSKIIGPFKKLIKDPTFLDLPGKVEGMNKCQRCGMCCMATSHLFMNDDDSRRVREYMKQHNIRAQNQLEKGSVVRPIENLSNTKNYAMCFGKNGHVGPMKPCPLFIPGKGCSIYPARPKICQIYVCWDSELYFETRQTILNSSYTVRCMEEEIYREG